MTAYPRVEQRRPHHLPVFSSPRGEAIETSVGGGSHGK